MEPPVILTGPLLARLDRLRAQGRYFDMLDALQDHVEDGLEQGLFTADQAMGDLALALCIARIDLQTAEYECYWQALRWLRRTQKAAEAAACGEWYECFALALLHTGQLQTARAACRQGLQTAAPTPGLCLAAAALEGHFGRAQAAQAALRTGRALAPGDGRFETARRLLEAGADLERMAAAFLSPQPPQPGEAPLACILCDAENLGRAAAALQARDWAYQEPYCCCRIPLRGGWVPARLQMNEAGASKLSAAWLAEFVERLPALEAQARSLVEQKHPQTRLELAEVLLDRQGRALLGYHVGKSREEALYAYALVPHSLQAPAELRYESYDMDAEAAEQLPPGPAEVLAKLPLAAYTPAQRRAVLRHIESWYGIIDRVLPPQNDGLEICVIGPRRHWPYYTLVTLGMGARRMDLPPDLAEPELERAELLMLLPGHWQIDAAQEKWHWPLRWLRLMALLPAEQNTWLGWGHTIPNGRPFAPNTLLSGVMLVDPLAAAPPAAVCPLPQGGVVNLYQLLPLYDEELAFKLEQDADALLDRMEQQDLFQQPCVVIDRPNACGPGEPLPDPALLEQLDEWDRQGEHQRIVTALEPLAGGGQSYVLAGLLAQAYNQLGRCAQAEALLLRVSARGAADPLWHFRLGYAYYYTDRELQALEQFERADQLAPGDGDTDLFLQWCRSAVALPVQKKPFTARAAQFWAAFAGQEQQLYAAAQAGGPQAVRPAVERLLALCFAAPCFTLAWQGQRLCLTVECGQTPHRAYLLPHWLAGAPASAAPRWQFCAPGAAPQGGGTYAFYRHQPLERPDRLRRQDVIAGSSCFEALVRGYHAADDSLVDAALADGAVCGFLFYTSSGLPEEEVVALRARLEDRLRAEGEGCAVVLGGAVGFDCSYIDLLALDLQPCLELARRLLAPLDCAEKGFHVFRANSPGVDLKELE